MSKKRAALRRQMREERDQAVQARLELEQKLQDLVERHEEAIVRLSILNKERELARKVEVEADQSIIIKTPELAEAMEALWRFRKDTLENLRIQL